LWDLSFRDSFHLYWGRVRLVNGEIIYFDLSWIRIFESFHSIHSWDLDIIVDRWVHSWKLGVVGHRVGIVGDAG
jgi:hypothetical protein